ncbi:MAG: hypothetical protein HZB59_01530 [Ignavibacteriales bacterium]|nr:hypothetical protein [Ignavibacteriales bacterium]
MLKSWKIALAILLMAAIVWLGGINIRAMVGFDLLQMGTLDFKPNIHPFVERAVFSLIAQSSMVIYVAYLIVWICGIVFLKTSPFRLKDNGWLMMTAILFYLFTPVEIYSMILDLKLWYLDHLGSNDLVEFRKLLIHRLAALSGVPMIALLSYYTAIIIAVLQPMKKSAVN